MRKIIAQRKTFDLYCWHGLKAQKHLALGNALGKYGGIDAPCKGKSIKFPLKLNAFALTGRHPCSNYS